jgi:hypothetical protein
VLVRNNGTDLTQVRQILNQTTLSTIAPLRSTEPIVPPLSNVTFANIGNISAPAETLELAARILPATPAFDSNDAASASAQLTAAGLSNGHYTAPSTANLTLASSTVQSSITSYGILGARPLSNGWSTWSPQGLYADNYIGRAFLSLHGYLALVSSEVLYPTYTQSLSLKSGESYLYSFSSRPPLDPTGFWSLTMYGEDGYLVQNGIGRYAVGDRSNITFPDEKRVYGSTESGANEGGFQILVQSAGARPPANWTNK